MALSFWKFPPQRLILLPLTLPLIVLALIVGILSIIGFLGHLDWRLDLTNHFVPAYLLVHALLLPLFLFAKARKWAGFVLLSLLLNLVRIAPLYLKIPSQPSTAGIPIKLIQFNVCAPTKDFHRTALFLKQQRADIAVLEECNERCYQHLQRDKVLASYPYQFRSPLRHRLVILSHFPLKAFPGPTLTAEPAVAWLMLNIQKQPVLLLAMHSTRPSSGAPYYRNQWLQFEIISRTMRNTPTPALMVGDLNTSPWGASFQMLLDKSGLQNSMDGFGLQLSFPVFIPHHPKAQTFPIVAIDHVLASQHFMVLNRQLGPDVGSDHLPVIVDLALKPTSAPNLSDSRTQTRNTP